MVSNLYHTDYEAWLAWQMTALRAGDVAALDLDNLIDELESIGRSASHQVWHALRELLVWFLCWGYAVDQRGRHPHWHIRIGSYRAALDAKTHVWPHLIQEAEDDLPGSYAYAREVASEETGLPLETFPETCPWPVALIMHPCFWPMGCEDTQPIWPEDVAG